MTDLSPAQREQVRLSLLRYCMRGSQVSLLRQYLKSEGHGDLTPDQVKTELGYLQDKGLVRSKGKVLSPEVAIYETTAAGMDLLAEAGTEA